MQLSSQTLQDAFATIEQHDIKPRFICVPWSRLVRMIPLEEATFDADGVKWDGKTFVITGTPPLITIDEKPDSFS